MFTLEEGKFLVRLARYSIETHLETGERPETPEVGEKLRRAMGVFVTLRKDGNLRGCIGRPYPTQPLVEGLMDSAINSATGDPRFPNLTREELDEVEIEVSVLTPPQTIEVEDPKEYPEKIEVGKDGLVVKSGGLQGLLLPQVPIEQDWDVEDFLSNSCMKAGLSPDCWLQKQVEIKKFTAQIFEEKTPKGAIEERSLKETQS